MNNKFTMIIGGIVTAAVLALAASQMWFEARMASLSDRLDQLTQAEPKLPPLSPKGETLRQQYLTRLEVNSPYGLKESDKCSAYYTARHQSERIELREKFITSSQADGHSEEEIDRVIELDQKGDTPYALYVFMSCGSGEKPLAYNDFMKPKF